MFLPLSLGPFQTEFKKILGTACPQTAPVLLLLSAVAFLSLRTTSVPYPQVLNPLLYNSDIAGLQSVVQCAPCGKKIVRIYTTN